VLPGSVRQVRPGAKVLGAAGADEWIEITLKLRRKQPLPEPSSRPGKVLSRADLEANYGASADDVEKVRTVLTGLGLSILSEDPGSRSMKAGGTADIVEEVFDITLLPRSAGRFISYQLIRNVLAAHAGDFDFCVMLDARRPDLLEAWHTIMRAVKPTDLRTRCKVLTWQELSGELSPGLRQFLRVKYGIFAPALP